MSSKNNRSDMNVNGGSNASGGSMDPSAHAALDGAHLDEIEKAFARLEQLEQRASAGPWREGKGGGAVVTDIYQEDVNAPTLMYYGGSPILESCRAADREFIIAIRNHARTLILQCKNMTAIMAESDAVHAGLGISYNESAASVIRALKARCESAECGLRVALEQRDQLLNDSKQAAGELMVDITECAPGTTAGKILSANVLLRQRLSDTREKYSFHNDFVRRLQENLRTADAAVVRLTEDLRVNAQNKAQFFTAAKELQNHRNEVGRLNRLIETLEAEKVRLAEQRLRALEFALEHEQRSARWENWVSVLRQTVDGLRADLKAVAGKLKTEREYQERAVCHLKAVCGQYRDLYEDDDQPVEMRDALVFLGHLQPEPKPAPPAPCPFQCGDEIERHFKYSAGPSDKYRVVAVGLDYFKAVPLTTEKSSNVQEITAYREAWSFYSLLKP